MASCYYDNQQFIVAMATRPVAVRSSEVVGVWLGSAVESVGVRVGDDDGVTADVACATVRVACVTVGVACATVGVACATRNNSIKNETIKN